jgi:hypothetical protein
VNIAVLLPQEIRDQIYRSANLQRNSRGAQAQQIKRSLQPVAEIPRARDWSDFFRGHSFAPFLVNL